MASETLTFFFLWLAHHCMLARCLWLEYCRAWFSELPFYRTSESTTGYTSLCGIFDFPWYKHHIKGTTSFYCLFWKTQAMWGEQNCLSFETAVGGIEPPSPRLTVRRSTAWPLVPTTQLSLLLSDQVIITTVLYCWVYVYLTDIQRVYNSWWQHHLTDLMKWLGHSNVLVLQRG